MNHDLDIAAANELRKLAEIFMSEDSLDEAAKVIQIIEQLERRANSNVVQMNGWESASQSQLDSQSG